MLDKLFKNYKETQWDREKYIKEMNDFGKELIIKSFY